MVGRRLSPVQRRARGLATTLANRGLIYRRHKGTDVVREVANAVIPLLEAHPHFEGVMNKVLQKKRLRDSGVLVESHSDQARRMIWVANEKALEDELLKRGSGDLFAGSSEGIMPLLGPAVRVIAERMNWKAEEAAIRRRVYVEPRVVEEGFRRRYQRTMRR